MRFEKQKGLFETLNLKTRSFRCQSVYEIYCVNEMIWEARKKEVVYVKYARFDWS
jgi:hypothetical protein